MPWRRAVLQDVAWRSRSSGEGGDYYSLSVWPCGQVELYADRFCNLATAHGGRSCGADIHEFSSDARRRMKNYLMGIRWDLLTLEHKKPLWVAVTYPQVFPHDGHTAKADIDALCKRLERALGPLPMVWKREFQERGAPHYHLIVIVSEEISRQSFQAVLRAAWSSVAGHATEAEIKQCCHVEDVKDVKKLSAYCADYFNKGDQNTVPESWYEILSGSYEHCTAKSGKKYQVYRWREWLRYDEPYVNPGRWWGVRRKSEIPWEKLVYPLTREQFESGSNLVFDLCGKKPACADSLVRIKYAQYDEAKFHEVLECFGSLGKKDLTDVGVSPYSHGSSP